MTQIEARDNIEDMIKFVAKGGIIIFLGSIIGKALRFIFYIILTRVLGAASYGLYSLGQGIIDIVTNIGLLGDGKAMIRFGAVFLNNKDRAKLKGTILGFLLLTSTMSIIIAGLIFTFAEYLSLHYFQNLALTKVLRLFSVGLPFYVFSLACIPIGLVFHRTHYKVIVQEIFQPTVNIVVVIMIFLLGWRLFGAVTAFIISSIASALLALYLIKRVFPERTTSILQIKQILLYSAPLIIILFSYYLVLRLDRIMLGIFRSPYEVGVYSAASNIAAFVLGFSSIFEISFGPVIAQLSHANKKEELRKIYNLVTIWGLVLTFIPCIGLIIFNREVLLVFGGEFTSGKWVLIILSLAFFLDIIPGQARQLFQMSANQNIELMNSLVIIVTNVTLNLILVSQLGMTGAALSTFFSLLLVSTIRLIEIKKIFGFLPFTKRHMKFIIFAISVVIFSLKVTPRIELYQKILLTVGIMATFILLLSRIKSSEDTLIWQAIKRRFYRAQ